jgi:hypothetical protein
MAAAIFSAAATMHRATFDAGQAIASTGGA